MHPGLVPRRLCVVNGTSQLRSVLQDWVISLFNENFKVIWLGQHVPQACPGSPTAQAGHWLGHEAALVVLEWQDTSDSEALAMAGGLVLGGGILLLVVPPALLAPVPAPQLTAFSQRLRDFLHEDWVHHLTLTTPWPVPDCRGPWAPQTLTPEQETLITDLHHWRRTGCSALLTAARGRGKSTVLGSVLAAWSQHAGLRWQLTAPTTRALNSVLRRVGQIIHTHPPLHGRWYRGPAALITSSDLIDLLIIEEAASLPLHELQRLTQRAPQGLFVTTTTGFEGSGGGFKLRFARYLQTQGRCVHHYTLTHPVRWPAHDPLENWIERLFLLASGPFRGWAANAWSTTGRCVEEQTLTLSWHQNTNQLASPSWLADAVELLQHAHYRTRPSDLQRWLDTPTLTFGIIHRAGTPQQPLGAIIVHYEPGLTTAMAEAVWHGQRRPAGHFLPCIAATHGAWTLATHPALRILRLAVHPNWRRHGLGSRLVAAARHQAHSRGAWSMGASFGATPELLRFWKRNGLTFVRLGFQPEVSSGCPAAVVATTLTPIAAAALLCLQHQVARSWAIWRHGPLQNLEPELATYLDQWSQNMAAHAGDHGNAAADLATVWSFAWQQHPLEPALPALARWVQQHPDFVKSLAPQRQIEWLGVVIHQGAWQTVQGKTQLAQRNAVIRCLRSDLRAYWVRCEAGLLHTENAELNGEIKTKGSKC